MRCLQLSCWFHRWGKWGPEKLCNFSSITQLVSGQLEIFIFTPYSFCPWERSKLLLPMFWFEYSPWGRSQAESLIIFKLFIIWCLYLIPSKSHRSAHIMWPHGIWAINLSEIVVLAFEVFFFSGFRIHSVQAYFSKNAFGNFCWLVKFSLWTTTFKKFHPWFYEKPGLKP